MLTYPTRFDVIVVGGGHAGCEAAAAASALGCRTLLLTLTIESIGAMSCNPAVGGQAKGHLVKEIDALGGLMGRVTDAAAIQYRVLNRSKGPAVRSSRAQCDTARYRRAMLEALFACPGLSVQQGKVEALLVEDGRVAGVSTVLGVRYESTAVVLTTGTFLRGLCHVGLTQFAGGRAGDDASEGLAASLAGLALRLGRHKTGTPPRLDGRTIDWEALEVQPGEDPPQRFSFYHRPPLLPQRPCHITYTNAQTHGIIAGATDQSPLFTGVIQGIGPRYCPSIEDKVVRFADKDRHQIFLEPMGLDTVEIYPNGLSTSLPLGVQLDFLRTVPGLERAAIIRPGYAVEYDYVLPQQLQPSLAMPSVPGLFLAGQINGTSGYEEAGAQGLVAGVNAAHAVLGRESFVLGRDESYIGVLIDDLVTRGTSEPYRMFTSRAEFRLLLREDNADRRLSERGRALGLLGDEAWAAYTARRDAHARVLQALRETWVSPSAENQLVADRLGLGRLKENAPVATLLKRPHVTLRQLAPLLPGLALEAYDDDVLEGVEIEVRFEGYIVRQEEQVARFRELEDLPLPADLDYGTVHGLSAEIVEKLTLARPRSIGQAARISGVTPAAMNALLIHVRKSGFRQEMAS